MGFRYRFEFVTQSLCLAQCTDLQQTVQLLPNTPYRGLSLCLIASLCCSVTVAADIQSSVLSTVTGHSLSLKLKKDSAILAPTPYYYYY